MALDKLGIYNDALLIIGERSLASLTEARETRYRLDAAWDIGAVDYCLEIIQPRSASLTSKLTVSSTDPDHGFSNVYSLPADYINVVGVFSDAALDQPISRYLIEGRSLLCDYSTLYLRYTTNSTTYDVSDYTPSFAKVVAAFLAREITQRFSSDDLETINSTFEQRVKTALELDSEKEPIRRPKATTGTLTADWLSIYNDALLILGLDKLTNGADDSYQRSVLDTAIDSGLVESMIEDIGWQFAMTSYKSEYNPSIAIDWGYSYAHNYPTDMLFLNGIYADERFNSPIKHYQTESDVIFTDYQEFYVQYVSTSFLATPSAWTRTFRRYVAAQMAKDTVAILQSDEGRVEHIWKQRKRASKSLDAMQSPPRMITAGNWSRARLRGDNSRGRP